MAGGNGKATATLEKFGRLFLKLNIQLFDDPATARLGIYSKEMKTYIHPNLYTNGHGSFRCKSQTLESAPIESVTGEELNEQAHACH